MKKTKAIALAAFMAVSFGAPALAQHHPFHAKVRPLLYDPCHNATEDGARVGVINQPNHFHPQITAVKQSRRDGADCVGVGVFIDATGFDAGNWSIDVNNTTATTADFIVRTQFSDGTFSDNFDLNGPTLSFHAHEMGFFGKKFASIYIMTESSPISLRFSDATVDDAACTTGTNTDNVSSIPGFICDCFVNPI